MVSQVRRLLGGPYMGDADRAVRTSSASVAQEKRGAPREIRGLARAEVARSRGIASAERTVKLAHGVTGAWTAAGIASTALLPMLGRIAPRAPRTVRVDHARTLALAGGRIRFHSAGTGDEALLFLHGFNSQLSVWDAVWPRLGEAGRRVRIDIAGYGGSRWVSDSYALPAQADRVLQFLDALELARVTVVGVSMGGSLAAWLAAHHPERITGVVLLSPSGYPGALRYRGPFGRLLRPGVANAWATQLARTSVYRRLYPTSRALHALTVTASYGDAWAHALSRIRAHTWLVWSRGDATVPFAYAEAVARSIPACTLVPVSASVRHDIPGQRPELIARLACRVHEGVGPEHIARELEQVLQQEGDA